MMKRSSVLMMALTVVFFLVGYVFLMKPVEEVRNVCGVFNECFVEELPTDELPDLDKWDESLSRVGWYSKDETFKRLTLEYQYKIHDILKLKYGEKVWLSEALKLRNEISANIDSDSIYEAWGYKSPEFYAVCWIIMLAALVLVKVFTIDVPYWEQPFVKKNKANEANTGADSD